MSILDMGDRYIFSHTARVIYRQIRRETLWLDVMTHDGIVLENMIY
jgi:hypothetical protein